MYTLAYKMSNAPNVLRQITYFRHRFSLIFDYSPTLFYYTAKATLHESLFRKTNQTEQQVFRNKTIPKKRLKSL